MTEHKINLAIQLLPLSNLENKYALIDEAIALITNSGLPYKVCPFETVIEGSFEETMKIIAGIRKLSHENNCDEIILNIKIHSHAKQDLFISDKTGKYE